MPVETLGEACSQGWRVTLRCADGRTESPRSQSSRECNYRRELDMETLVWTRGRAFPLSRLESRLRCPRDQPRCEPCHTQSETDLGGPVICPCRWLAKNRHGKSMSRLQSESS